MRTGLGRDSNPTRLRLPDHPHRSGRAEMRKMQMGPGQLGQREIASHHDFFRRRWNPGKSQLRGHDPLVHAAVFREMQILAVIDHRQIERERILHGAPHHLATHHRLPVIGDGYTAGMPQLADFCQLLAFGALGDRTHRKHMGVPGRTGLVEDELGDGLIIIDRGRVRSGGLTWLSREPTHGGEPSGHSRCGPCGNRFLVFEPRFAQVHV